MHTIHNIAFEVDINYNNPLVSWEQYYVDFFQERLLPRVERMCDDWDKKYPNSKCVIDAIDIDVDVNNVDLETLQKEIIQQISKQLHGISSDGTNSEGKKVAIITKQAAPFEALIGYLSEGILPAHISVKAFKEWLGAVAEFTSVEKKRLSNLCATKSVAIERMLSLLRNDYVKLSTIITKKQQITTQSIRFETTFFQQLLKAICTQFKLNYKTEEAEIWYKTLGVSSSLPQFSKTLLQLLTPKAQAEHKRLTKVNETQLTVLVLQAITQYETGNSITIDASKIATIVKEYQAASQAEKQTTALQKSKANNSEEAQAAKETKLSKSKGSSAEAEQTKQAKETTKKLQAKQKGSIAKKKVSSEDITKTAKTAAGTQNKTETSKATANASHLAEANNTQKESIPPILQNSFAKELNLTTEKAGLILLHPFLSQFIKGVGLLNEDNEITNVGKACTLLHYLATEMEEVTDVELTLEKVLLGIPFETIINYQTSLTEKDKEGCEELLSAVLEHWQVLKKSTKNTLRDLFIKRDGQLTLTKETIKLKIERAAQDVLLEKIPWNISLFRLKWMEKMMHIEW